MMETNNLIQENKVREELDKYGFFPLFTKRNKEKNKLVTTYLSIKYPYTTIKTQTLRIKPHEDKILLGIKINEQEITNWKDLIYNLKHIYKFNKRK
jgi:hypothetical protein